MTFTINKFLGINQAHDENSLKVGESTKMNNFVIKNKNLCIRDGIKIVKSFGENLAIQGAIKAKVYPQPHERLFFVASGTLYEYDYSNDKVKTIGELDNFYENPKIMMCAWSEKIYIITGTEYYCYDGKKLEITEGYVPMLRTGVMPDGTGGVFVGERNLISRYAIMSYIGDGESELYTLPVEAQEISYVKINGVETSDYTLTNNGAKVKISNVPGTGDIVEIKFKGYTGHGRILIGNCVHGMTFGGSNDSCLFLWGDYVYPYRRYHSQVGDPTYFPENNYSDIGSKSGKISDIVSQYDRQIIFTDREIFYSVIDDSDALNISFPVYSLNSSVGNKADAEVRIVNNNPVFLFGGVRELCSSNVRDEKNVREIGARVEELSDINLENAITYDYEQNHEYYISVGDKTYVYNYKEDVWYTLSGFTPVLYINIEDKLHFFDNKGNLCRFEKNQKYDICSDGQIKSIKASWEMPFYDFDEKAGKKFTNKAWVEIVPKSSTKFDISFENNRGVKICKKTLLVSQMDFTDLSFELFDFSLPRYNPISLPIKCKGYQKIKIKLESDSAFTTACFSSVAINVNTAKRTK
ncbi:MAG: hypothetical protein E7480_08215 [Ruminococcaceae bacterium]|nr:hypothetical protein [Oscillospiraceae bacterium]